MPHGTALIATICVSLAVAFLGGFLAVRLRLPPLIGYVLAGVAVGPFTPGFVADLPPRGELAEIGVMLLMFGVGLHFSLRDLLAVRTTALSGALTQMATATALPSPSHASGVGRWGRGSVFGLALSVASTVVLLRASRRRAPSIPWTAASRSAGSSSRTWSWCSPSSSCRPSRGCWAESAWLCAWRDHLLCALGLTLAKVAAFVARMLLAGARLLPWLLDAVVRTGSRELFTLAVVAVALGVAYGAAALFGVSFALGAFFAGVVINESDHSHRAGGRVAAHP